MAIIKLIMLLNKKPGLAVPHICKSWRQELGEKEKESSLKSCIISKHPRKSKPATLYLARSVSGNTCRSLSLLIRCCPLEGTGGCDTVLQEDSPGPQKEPFLPLPAKQSQHWSYMCPSLSLMPPSSWLPAWPWMLGSLATPSGLAIWASPHNLREKASLCPSSI